MLFDELCWCSVRCFDLACLLPCLLAVLMGCVPPSSLSICFTVRDHCAVLQHNGPTVFHVLLINRDCPCGKAVLATVKDVLESLPSRFCVFIEG